jgi:hypothetical protein
VIFFDQHRRDAVVIEFVTNLIITALSTLFFAYWSRYTCLLILAQSPADFDRLYALLDRDYAAITALVF